jgi:hypothetical protein
MKHKAALADRRHDLYETHPVAVRVEALPRGVLGEPACGRGAIVRVLRGAGHRVLATDLVDYHSPDQDAAQRDFFLETKLPPGVERILNTACTNGIHTRCRFRRAASVAGV